MNMMPGMKLPPSRGMPPTPQAPLHDIVGPFSFFAYTPTQVIVAVLLFFIVLGSVFWIIRRLRRKAPLTPQQACLEALAKMRKNLLEGNDHEFGSHVSGLLRDYLGAAFGLAAPRQTTEEFLQSLRDHNRFTSQAQEALKKFLLHADFLKFAHGSAAENDRLALITAAEEFVQGETLQTPEANESKEVATP